MLRVVRDLCGSSSPTPLLKQGPLQQAAQEHVQTDNVLPFFLASALLNATLFYICIIQYILILNLYTILVLSWGTV